MSLPVPEVRPKNVTALVDDTFRLYGRRWQDFVALGIPAFVPFSVLSALVRRAIGLNSGFRTALGSAVLERATGAVAPVDWGVAVPALIALALVTAIATFVYFLAITYAASQSLLGQRVQVMDAYVVALEQFVAEMLLSLKYVVFVAVLFILIVTIPVALYLLVAWGMAYHVILFEGRGAWSATGRSRALVKGNWWRLVGMTLLLGIITGFFGGLAGTLTSALAAMGLGGVLVGGVVAGLASAALQPITYIGWLLLYLDLRARHDGPPRGEFDFSGVGTAPLQWR